MRNRKNRVILLVLLLSAGISIAAALPSDKNQPMHLIADQGQLNKSTGISVFTGHVMLTQGTSALLADTLTLHTDKRQQLILAQALGKLAHYHTITDINQPPFKADAEEIDYYPLQGQLILRGNAKVTQGQNRYAAPLIVYHINQEMVVSPASSQGRTTIVISPQTIRPAKRNS